MVPARGWVPARVGGNRQGEAGWLGLDWPWARRATGTRHGRVVGGGGDSSSPSAVSPPACWVWPRLGVLRGPSPAALKAATLTM